MKNPQAPTSDRAVAAYAAERGIEEVLHFTTNRGLLGILATGAVLSRDRLETYAYIEHIYAPNCEDRLKDQEWIDYVNLSISRVNGRMLGVSENWHTSDDIWWVVLSFDASLLADPEVHFTTTNNTYTTCVKRGMGINGLEALFADSVEWGWYGSRKSRYLGMPNNWTTDPQAEVLYPCQVPTDRLRAIYVREAERTDDVKSLFAVFPGAPRVPVVHRPEVFQ